MSLERMVGGKIVFRDSSGGEMLQLSFCFVPNCEILCQWIAGNGLLGSARG